MMRTRNIFITSVIGAVSCIAAHAIDIPWLNKPTICRIDTTQCYISMGMGYDSERWDAESKCRGVKYICPAALLATGNAPKLMGRADIKRGTGLRPEFDTEILDGDCFGARRTKNNGTMASVSGMGYVNVYCNDVPIDADEYLSNGKIITSGAQPTCGELAEYGYVGILDAANGCYGKYYDMGAYTIECGAASDILPQRIVILNGAQMGGASSDAPADINAAKQIFDEMYETSRLKYEAFLQTLQN